MPSAADNPFSLARYWAQGDALSHALAALLLAMSIFSWCVILAKAFSAWRGRAAASALTAFWSAPSMDDAIALLRHADSERLYLSLPVQGAAQACAAATLGNAVGRAEQLTRVLRCEITATTHRVERGLTLLASIGATAPFIGLLGTVWGIYHALAGVSVAGAVAIDKVAGPVGEALVMTGFGLIVAIPAVLAYNGFNRINRMTLAQLDGFAYDLHAYFSRQP